MICKYCKKEFIHKSNSQLYCSKSCYHEDHKEDRKIYIREYQRLKSGRYEDGKVQCLICGKYYHKVISHVWQVHGIYEREYKQRFGLDHKRGLISKITYDKLKRSTTENWDKIKENLLVKGFKTRFRSGDGRAGIYKRSPQTLERLRLQHK